jgi:hypothetical protein
MQISRRQLSLRYDEFSMGIAEGGKSPENRSWGRARFVSGQDFSRAVEGQQRFGLYRLRKKLKLLKGTAFRPHVIN